MLSLGYIQEIVKENTERARDEGLEPANVQDIKSGHVRAWIRTIPFLGDYCPEGWYSPDEIEDLFVDSSGFGSENEPALTIAQFEDIVWNYKRSGDSYGFAIVEAGQFQVVIRVYKPNPRDFTHTGKITARDYAAR